MGPHMVSTQNEKHPNRKTPKTASEQLPRAQTLVLRTRRGEIDPCLSPGMCRPKSKKRKKVNFSLPSFLSLPHPLSPLLLPPSPPSLLSSKKSITAIIAHVIFEYHRTNCA